MSRNRFPELDKYEFHKRYLEKVAPILIEAENTVNEIKLSKEWKRTYGYFQTLYNRGYLKERPTKANGYQVQLGANAIRLADIEDLLTPEQIEAIKKRM
jgi:hypothetical protein